MSGVTCKPTMRAMSRVYLPSAPFWSHCLSTPSACLYAFYCHQPRHLVQPYHVCGSNASTAIDVPVWLVSWTLQEATGLLLFLLHLGQNCALHCFEAEAACSEHALPERSC